MYEHYEHTFIFHFGTLFCHVALETEKGNPTPNHTEAT